MALNEFSIIERYFTSSSHRKDVLLGVGDDAALLQVPQGMQLAVSVDTLVAGRHFPEDTAAEAVGHKTLAVNLSDMAAMGAEPAWATLAITLPDADPAFVDAFAEGFFNLARRFDVELVGGDTVRGPLSLTVQVQGLVPAGEALLRSGARPGDYLYVSGSLGDAGAGLRLRPEKNHADAESAKQLIRRLEYPTPRVAEGVSLRGIASAVIDVSDGLLADLGHILARSGCGAEVELDAIPRSKALSRCIAGQEEQLRLALSAGDDYELCFAVPAARLNALEGATAKWRCGATCIGRITEGTGIRLRGEKSDTLTGMLSGYDHFQG
ncbi:MAG: thiamine-phosphate kinase [Pseudomonadota bacterium]